MYDSSFGNDGLRSRSGVKFETWSLAKGFKVPGPRCTVQAAGLRLRIRRKVSRCIFY